VFDLLIMNDLQKKSDKLLDRKTTDLGVEFGKCAWLHQFDRVNRNFRPVSMIGNSEILALFIISLKFHSSGCRYDRLAIST
jgi:hypothetical protein